MKSLVFGILARKKRFSFWRRMIFQFRGSESSFASCGIRRISRPTCHRTKCFRKIHTRPHRVNRVPGFLSSRPNWVPPNPHSLASVAPPSLQGGETHSHTGEGFGGDPIPTKGQTLWNSHYVYFIIPLRPALSISCPSQRFCLLSYEGNGRFSLSLLIFRHK